MDEQKMPGYVYDDGYDIALAKASVGIGWHGLLKEIFDVIPADVRVIQVKEKIGGLRCYIDNATRETFEIVDAICDRSYTICEDCGQPGRLRQGGWLRTLCDQHSRYKPSEEV